MRGGDSLDAYAGRRSRHTEEAYRGGGSGSYPLPGHHPGLDGRYQDASQEDLCGVVDQQRHRDQGEVLEALEDDVQHGDTWQHKKRYISIYKMFMIVYEINVPFPVVDLIRGTPSRVYSDLCPVLPGIHPRP